MATKEIDLLTFLVGGYDLATIDLPILGMNVAPDDSGDIFVEPLEAAMTLGTAVFKNLLGITMLAPTGTDIGINGKFNIPQGYVDTPILVIRGALGGTPANDLAFGMQIVAVADSETVDVALEAADLAENGTWTGYAIEEMYEETIALTPSSAFVKGDEVFFFFFRDDDQDTTTFDFHLTGLFFRYNDA